MRKKLLFMVVPPVLFLGYYPIHVSAVMYLFTVNVVKNSVGGDGTFNFHSTIFDNSTGQNSNLQDFQIQTQNGNGSYSFYGFPPRYGGNITMTESPTVGWLSAVDR